MPRDVCCFIHVMISDLWFLGLSVLPHHLVIQVPSWFIYWFAHLFFIFYLCIYFPLHCDIWVCPVSWASCSPPTPENGYIHPHLLKSYASCLLVLRCGILYLRANPRCKDWWRRGKVFWIKEPTCAANFLKMALIESRNIPNLETETLEIKPAGSGDSEGPGVYTLAWERELDFVVLYVNSEGPVCWWCWNYLWIHCQEVNEYRKVAFEF